MSAIRITQEREVILQKIYGSEAICGYIRDPVLDNNEITGLCALDRKPCTHRLPMEMDKCEKYRRKFE